MSSQKVSPQGLLLIKQAIAQRGWRVGDERWLVEASRLLEPEGDWPIDGPYAYGCSLQTWERFLQRVAIRDRSFNTFCQMLNLSPHEVAESAYPFTTDWGCAPDAPTLCGREQELETLARWIFEDRCRLINVVGFAGIGKTRLLKGGLCSAALASRIQKAFDCLIWRRLDARSPEMLLKEIVAFVADSNETSLELLPETVDGLVTQLLHCLKQRRCLIVIDGADLERDRRYADIFGQIAQVQHQSCVIVASRERAKDVDILEGMYPVRSLPLSGLELPAVQKLFQDIDQSATFRGSPQDWKTLIATYGGNPLMLEVVAKHIAKWFDGYLADFLYQNLMVFGKIRMLLDQHFESLSEAQKEIVLLLADRVEPVSIEAVRLSLLSSTFKRSISETLDSLERQLLIEREKDELRLLPPLREYVRDHLIMSQIKPKTCRR